MKELYTKPEVKVDEFETVDVMTASSANIDALNDEEP